MRRFCGLRLDDDLIDKMKDELPGDTPGTGDPIRSGVSTAVSEGSAGARGY